MNNELKEAIDNYLHCLNQDMEYRQKYLLTFYSKVMDLIMLAKNGNEGLDEDFIFNFIIYRSPIPRSSLMFLEGMTSNTCSEVWTVKLLRRIHDQTNEKDASETTWIMNLIVEKILKFHENLPIKTLAYLCSSPIIEEKTKKHMMRQENYYKSASLILDEMEELDNN